MPTWRRSFHRTLAFKIVVVAPLALVVVWGVREWRLHEKQRQFVAIGAEGFELEGDPFFPLAVNYILTKRLMHDSVWVGPSIDYPDSMTIPMTPTEDLEEMRGHMELIREMGFNTVRLVGGSDIRERDGRPFMPFRSHYKEDRWYALDTSDLRTRYLDGIEQVLEIVRGAGLKAILHVGVMPSQPTTEEHFIQIADRFADDPTILAYDLFNEPLYFDTLWRDKSEVRVVSAHWRALMQEHAPSQLWTVGLANLREFLEWDPTLIDADFFSFHPYEHEPLQVLNELYYYAHHCPKPWIVGETAIPADNDSIPYSEQHDFARSTLRQAVACGAWGYSWWQFKDVDWHRFHPNFLGVVNREGTTRTPSGRSVHGSVKPMAEVFSSFDPQGPEGECECPANYFNWTPGSANRLTGRMLDEDGHGVDNGVIMAWSQWWNKLANTVTHPDGTFELVTDIPLAHWTMSAPGRIRIHGEVDRLAPDTMRGGLTHAIGDTLVRKVLPVE